MLQNIDVLFSASCFNSAKSAERMARSIKYIDNCNSLFVIASPLESDLSYLRNCKLDNVLLFKSKLDNMYMCRNWGFIYARHFRIHPTYFCSCDDDIEFTPNSYDLLHRLDHNIFSVMTFNNGAQTYNWAHGAKLGSCNMMAWINGDSMFSRFEDNVRFGLPDCLINGEASPYCVESEYQQRMTVFTHKPLLADTERIFYVHHYRDTKDKAKLRSISVNTRINSGLNLFTHKYPDIFPQERIDINKVDVHTILRERINVTPNDAKRHLLYNGLWVDYQEIYRKYKDNFTQVL